MADVSWAQRLMPLLLTIVAVGGVLALAFS
jgi:hypothetical protein